MQSNSMKTLTCVGCGTTKPASEFPQGTGQKPRRRCFSCEARTEKPCAECGIIQPVEGYSWKQGRSKIQRRDNTCRKCRARRTREWVIRVGPKRAGRGRLMKTYGITEIDYADMLEAQSRACAICGDTEMPTDPRTGRKYDLAIDHDHATGKIRALLCPACNNGLGCFKDDPIRLHAAISYLAKHSRD